MRLFRHSAGYYIVAETLGMIGALIVVTYKVVKFILKVFYKIAYRIYLALKYYNTGMSYNKMKQAIIDASPRQFEIICANLFRMNGHYVELTPEGNDYGRDVIVDDEIYVECKHYVGTEMVGREICQKLIGSCAANGIRHGIVITAGAFHENACEYADRLNGNGEFYLELWDIDDLLELTVDGRPDSVRWALLGMK